MWSVSLWLYHQCFQIHVIHDDVIKWKHFPRYWPFVRAIHRSPVNSPHKGQWRGALMFSLICVWINGSVNNREAGDLRRYRAYYDVTVMLCPKVRQDWFIATGTIVRLPQLQLILWTMGELRLVIYKLISSKYNTQISCESALIRILQDHTDDQSTLVRVVTWCRHLPSSMTSYGVIGPKCVKYIQLW